jgi:ribosomal protein S18 acetylase RimI-like enzyme
MKLSLIELDVDNKSLLVECAVLHKQVYPKYLFTSRLPQNLLVKYYQAMALESKVVVCAMLDSQFVGVIFGGVGRLTFVQSFKRKHLFQLLLALALNIDMLLPMATKFIRSILEARSTDNDSMHTIDGRIYNILVSDSGRILGAPKQLVDEMIRKLTRLGSTSISLTIDERNSTVIRFWQQLAFQCDKTIGKSVEMSRKLK